jgi:hypothetical protein
MITGTNIHGGSQSVLAARTLTINAAGNPQNNAERPRASLPSERRSSVLGAGSGIKGSMKNEL